MDVIARYTKSTDTEKIEYGYDFVAKTFLKKPYTPIKGIQLALEERRTRILASQRSGVGICVPGWQARQHSLLVREQ